MSRGAPPRDWQPPRTRGGTQTKLIPIDFRRGLDQSQSPTMVPPGFATVLRNWIPEQVGGLRCRWAWIDHPHNNRESNDADNHSKPYPATRRKCRGIHYVNLTDGPGDANGGVWYAVPLYNPDATPANVAQLWVTRSNFTQGWYHIQDFPGAGDIDNYPVAMQVVARKKADGGAVLLYVHPDMASLNWWDGDIPATAHSIADVSGGNPKTKARPGRALGYHKSRVYMGGTSPSLDNVTYRLYYSDFDVDGFPDFTSWPDKNFIDVGKEDGEPILSLQSFQGVLFIGKPGGVFMLQGSDPSTFQLTKLDGTSASKGRSIVPTPTGVAILGQHEAWFWAGGDPQRISNAVQTSYELGAGQARFGGYADGRVYISSIDPSVPMLSFEVATGVWATEDVGSTDEHLTAVDVYNNRLVGCPYNSVLMAPMIYRDMPTGSRAKDPWNTLGTSYQARTGDVWITHERAPVVIRQLWVRTKRRGVVGANVPQAVIRLDGVAYRTIDLDVGVNDGDVAQGRHSMDGKTARSIGFELKHTPHLGAGAVFDIEEALAEVDVEQWR